VKFKKAVVDALERAFRSILFGVTGPWAATENSSRVHGVGADLLPQLGAQLEERYGVPRLRLALEAGSNHRIEQLGTCDRPVAALLAALGFAGLPMPSYDRALWALRKPAGFFDNNRAGSSV